MPDSPKSEWKNAEMYVMRTLDSISAKLTKIEGQCERNAQQLVGLDKELKIRSSMYGALGSIVGAAVLKYAFGG